MSGPEIIIIHETAAQSIVSDAVTLATFGAMIGIGVWMGSDAMQWTGGICFFCWMLARRKAPRLTIAEARRRLVEIEKEHA
ncbi:hypothetical protein [Xanthobacter sp. 91]|uniref:hypothetical protein n=1 Tax=Xanthobacter sp. 91 TaxID=1117244 RepID=UPI000496ACBF|nr:hypothetical protein [Xanthobacter sp. 91]